MAYLSFPVPPISLRRTLRAGVAELFRTSASPLHHCHYCSLRILFVLHGARRPDATQRLLRMVPRLSRHPPCPPSCGRSLRFARCCGQCCEAPWKASSFAHARIFSAFGTVLSFRDAAFFLAKPYAIHVLVSTFGTVLSVMPWFGLTPFTTFVLLSPFSHSAPCCS
jgi:hypothetical protein